MSELTKILTLEMALANKLNKHEELVWEAVNWWKRKINGKDQLNRMMLKH